MTKYGYPLNANALARAAATLAVGRLQQGVGPTQLIDYEFAFWAFYDDLCAEDSRRDKERVNQNKDRR